MVPVETMACVKPHRKRNIERIFKGFWAIEKIILDLNWDLIIFMIWVFLLKQS